MVALRDVSARITALLLPTMHASKAGEEFRGLRNREPFSIPAQDLDGLLSLAHPEPPQLHIHGVTWTQMGSADRVSDAISLAFLSAVARCPDDMPGDLIGDGIQNFELPASSAIRFGHELHLIWQLDPALRLDSPHAWRAAQQISIRFQEAVKNALLQSGVLVLLDPDITAPRLIAGSEAELVSFQGHRAYNLDEFAGVIRHDPRVVWVHGKSGQTKKTSPPIPEEAFDDSDDRWKPKAEVSSSSDTTRVVAAETVTPPKFVLPIDPVTLVPQGRAIQPQAPKIVSSPQEATSVSIPVQDSVIEAPSEVHAPAVTPPLPAQTLTPKAQEPFRQRPFLLRAVWYLFIGWWLGGLAIVVMYLMILSIILIPVGLLLLNVIPFLMTLHRVRPKEVAAEAAIQNPNILLRILWFIFLGWWLGGIAVQIAYFFCLINIGLPIGLVILNRLPTIMTLRRSQ